jgi:hypothetical protein
MLGVLISVVCLKCGNTEKKKFYVDTLDKFDKFFGVNCSCGNKDCEHFKLVKLDVAEQAKYI